jgi:lipopolysaccharide assembly protein A
MRAKLIVITILALLLVIFAVQNTEVTVVKLWFWQMNMARAILIFVSFAIGLIIGLLIPTFSGKKTVKEKGSGITGKDPGKDSPWKDQGKDSPWKDQGKDSPWKDQGNERTGKDPGKEMKKEEKPYPRPGDKI